ncbi:MAG: hypothetical protein NXI08_14350 [bacterium]|nr:hypothetical protein [bacterium]
MSKNDGASHTTKSDDNESTLSIIKEITQKNRCMSCGAWEGKKHPLIKQIVELETVPLNEKKVIVCQICSVRSKVIQRMKKPETIQKLTSYFFPTA